MWGRLKDIAAAEARRASPPKQPKERMSISLEAAALRRSRAPPACQPACLRACGAQRGSPVRVLPPNEHRLNASAFFALPSAQSLEIAPGAMETLDRISAGDMRKAITIMQSSARLHGSAVTSRTLEEVSGKVPDEAVSDLVAAVKANSFDRATAAVNSLIKDGYPGLQLMMQFFDACLRDASVTDAAKARISIKLAEADKARGEARGSRWLAAQ